MRSRKPDKEISRDREALCIAYAELRAIKRTAGFKKSAGLAVARIEALVPGLVHMPEEELAALRREL